MIKLKTSDIENAMRKKWCEPEYAVLWNVANGTGIHARRYADALIMSLWPSRGMELHGVEIKVSRSDWKHEAKDPTKAETIAKYCDRWYIHTPKGLIQDVSDVPPAWGVREFDGNKWSTLKEAEKTQAEPIDRSFLAAMLRRTAEADARRTEMLISQKTEEMEKYRIELRERYKTDVEREVKRRTQSITDKEEAIRLFEEHVGESIENYRWRPKEFSVAAKTLIDLQSEYGSIRNLPHLRDKLKTAHDAIEALIDVTQTKSV